MTYGLRTLSYFPEDFTMSKLQDADFGSTEEEEFFEDIHSPTDNSEDSVEVKVTPISSRNKRKCSEPRKVPEKFTGPLKKRMCLKVQSEKLSEKHADSAPFRPWSPKGKPEISRAEVNQQVKTEEKDSESKKVIEPRFVMPQIPVMHPFGFANPLDLPRITEGYFRPPSPIKYEPDEPVALIKKCQKTEVIVKKEPEVVCTSTSRQELPRVPYHPQASCMSQQETERLLLTSSEAFPALKRPESLSGKREQRNYKNMTRERRIEANARERTRVHTISAAFDTLRKSIPSYSHNQKLSKLSVLRIACSYIMTLSNIVKDDDPSKLNEGVDLITKTIQREGKLRKKKDDND
ncbi:uncharacterized protein LOC123317448 [Coccinella septempunctata]|uniref:uncharacterized protein LOC123317448 n=1 Tax=Coccinella septempunctata TaxID=41139 RepID=UPI001D070675|nr:uncharacterized protein LOC123317448 [Coccinella septempunctata]